MDSIKKHRPDLYEIYSKDISFYDYLKDLNKTDIEKNYFIERKLKFTKIIQEELKYILEEQELSKIYIDEQINTTDHFGIMQNWEIINNALSDFIRWNNKDGYISFPGWKIPLNNVTQPFILNFQKKKIDIFEYYKDKTKNEIITLLPEMPISKEKIDNMIKKHNLDIKYEKIFDIFIDNKENKNFIEQCIRLNKKLFNKTIDEDIPFIFLEKYYFVQKLLIELLKEGNNIIENSFENKEFLEKFSWKYWTDLFWLNENNKLKKLRYKNASIYDWEKHILDIINNKENLISLLQQRKIIISIEIMFCILSFYLWYECLWWFFQIKYLWWIKKNWLNTIENVDTKEYENVSKIRTNKLIGWFNIIKDKYLLDYILEEEKINILDIEKESKNNDIKKCINIDKIKKILRI